MSNEKQETIADIVAEMRIGDLCASYTAARSMYINDFLASYADRIEAAEKREIADEKRISDAVVQSLRDKKLEMAGEIVEKDAEISDLRAFVKEIADVLNNTKNYMCFHCTVRNCPGEYDCRDTKKYCLLIAKAGEVIGGAE